jgi:hypothetical protein
MKEIATGLYQCSFCGFISDGHAQCTCDWTGSLITQPPSPPSSPLDDLELVEESNRVDQMTDEYYACDVDSNEDDLTSPSASEPSSDDENVVNLHNNTSFVYDSGEEFEEDEEDEVRKLERDEEVNHSNFIASSSEDSPSTSPTSGSTKRKFEEEAPIRRKKPKKLNPKYLTGSTITCRKTNCNKTLEVNEAIIYNGKPFCSRLCRELWILE